MKSLFNQTLDEAFERYQQGGIMVGDRVRFKKNCLKLDFFKEKASEFIDLIKSYMQPGFDLNLRVGSVKSIYPTTTQNYQAGTESPDHIYVDVYVEYAPGLYARPMTVPIEALEVLDDGNNRGPIPDSLKRKSKIHGPEEIPNQSLPNQNVVLPNANKWNDSKPGGGNYSTSSYMTGR